LHDEEPNEKPRAEIIPTVDPSDASPNPERGNSNDFDLVTSDSDSVCSVRDSEANTDPVFDSPTDRVTLLVPFDKLSNALPVGDRVPAVPDSVDDSVGVGRNGDADSDQSTDAVLTWDVDGDGIEVMDAVCSVEKVGLSEADAERDKDDSDKLAKPAVGLGVGGGVTVTVPLLVLLTVSDRKNVGDGVATRVLDGVAVAVASCVVDGVGGGVIVVLTVVVAADVWLTDTVSESPRLNVDVG